MCWPVGQVAQLPSGSSMVWVAVVDPGVADQALQRGRPGCDVVLEPTARRQGEQGLLDRCSRARGQGAGGPLGRQAARLGEQLVGRLVQIERLGGRSGCPPRGVGPGRHRVSVPVIRFYK